MTGALPEIRPRRGRPVAVAAVLSTALAVAAAAPGAARGADGATLSDERTVTRWATALSAAPIRGAADPQARRVARLRYFTEDRLPEVYVLLERTTGTDDRTWIRVRVPMRPNGTTGWVPAEALNEAHTSRQLLWIDRRARRATLLRAGRAVWRSPVGVGRPSTPTPAGRFYVRERIDNLGGSPAYGPVAFGTSAYSRLSDWPGGGVVGIHGTDRPGLIPGRISHGCVRVPNRAIRRLARLLTVGTPVRIADTPPRTTGRSAVA